MRGRDFKRAARARAASERAALLRMIVSVPLASQSTLAAASRRSWVTTPIADGAPGVFLHRAPGRFEPIGQSTTAHMWSGATATAATATATHDGVNRHRPPPGHPCDDAPRPLSALRADSAISLPRRRDLKHPISRQLMSRPSASRVSGALRMHYVARLLVRQAVGSQLAQHGVDAAF